MLAVVVAAALAVGAWAFQPWRLVTSSEVTEAAPTSAPASAPDAAVGSPAVPEQSREPTTPPPSDRVLATGSFEDAEHATTGSARVLELADGTRFVRLEGLDTSDGPDLHVWLSDQPSGGDWGSYDDGTWVALGPLKANRGSHNYEIPAAAEIAGMRSVVIWCDRFNVAFGTAPVRLA